jgi:hypothetical protein
MKSLNKEQTTYNIVLSLYYTAIGNVEKRVTWNKDGIFTEKQKY